MSKTLVTAAFAAALAVAACQVPSSSDGALDVTPQPGLAPDAQVRLTAVLADDFRGDDGARDQYRNPAETIAFFGIEPGMTVVESLPSPNGYYTKILVPYLGEDATYYGLQYPAALAERIFPERFIARITTFPDRFTTSFSELDTDFYAPYTPAIAGGFLWDDVPEALAGQADVVFHARSLHHMWRGDEAALAVNGTWDMLKPGGVAAVVQHRATEDATAEQAKGDFGYLKQSDVIAAFEARGFVLEATSEINANPADATDYEIGVWRLPPALRVENEDAKAANLAIGETDRMTLKFRKPADA